MDGIDFHYYLTPTKNNFNLFFNSKYYTGRLTNKSALAKVDRVLTKIYIVLSVI